MHPNNKEKIISSAVLGIIGGLAIMIIGGNRGLETPFIYPKDTLIFIGLIWIFSILILYINFLWKEYRNLPFLLQIIILIPIALCLVLIRDFIDSGFYFYLRNTTFYDGIYAFIILLIGRKMLREDLDTLNTTFQWKRFIKRFTLFVLLAVILFIIHLFLLLNFGILSFF